MSSTIDRLRALEVLDSRGRPTVRAFCDIDGARAWATAPSGASTGSHEAWERCDGDPARYDGLGCRHAVAAIDDEIARLLVGRPFADHRQLDDALHELDGTPNLGRLGANATLATSLAAAVAIAQARRIELADYLASLPRPQTTPALPRPMVNLFSGGRQAGGQVAIQDPLIVSTAGDVSEQLRQIAQVYAAASRLVLERYGMRELTADEGGLAPAFESCGDLFRDAAEAVETTGRSLGHDIRFAVDVAASEFFDGGHYAIDGRRATAGELSAMICDWCSHYPIVGIEDGHAEDEWTRLRADLPAEVVLIGDDLLCTNAARVERAASEGAADGLLLKVNQAGTLSAAIDALEAARRAEWSVTVSARSGETEDRWLADAAVGWAGDYIKVGSVRQSERLAKCNRLLEIEAGFATW